MTTLSRVPPQLAWPVRGTVRQLTCLTLTIAFCLPLTGCSGCTQEAFQPAPAQSTSQHSEEQIPQAQASPNEPAEADIASSADTEQAELIPPVEQTPAGTDQDGTDQDAEAPRESLETADAGEPAGSGPGTAAPTSGTSSEIAPGDASAALTQAGRLQSEARAAAMNGNAGRAFQLASQSWEQIQPFQNQPACQSLVQELTADLQRYGQAANGKYGGKSRAGDRPLIEQ